MQQEFLKTKAEITEWLEQFTISIHHKIGNGNYALVEDPTYGYVVNVEGSVALHKENLSFIPVKFSHIKGNFDCSNNELTTLEFCPHTVDGDFDCANNQLVSLKHCPHTVGYHFSCNNNRLTSLAFCPHKIIGNFSCSSNQLTSLEFCPQEVLGNFSCASNNITSLKFSPQTVGASFVCSYNKLTSLEFCPHTVGIDFDCAYNQLTALDFCPAIVGSYYFFCYKNYELGKIQEINNFSEILKAHQEALIKKEKKNIEQQLGKEINKQKAKASFIKI